MTHFEVYLLTRLDSLHIALAAVLAASISASCYIVVATGGSKGAWENCINKVFKITIPFIIISALLKTLTPTTKEMAFIYIAPAIVNNKDMQETMTKLPNISKLGLEYIEETLKDNINNKIKENVSK